ncbi:MAG: hypothetical protein JWM41_855 [Gemmatimonadetes bacterium]|nr:hypothetical protein [Gemmatimonadota bacterium]
MPQATTVGRLLHELHSESPAVRDLVVRAAGLSAERADGAMSGDVKLSLSEQLRLSEATLLLAPDYARDALRLRGQALAARSYESGEFVESHRDAPIERWERSANLRR